MAKQLHVIHRHTSATLNPGSGSTDNAKLALGEIAVQHNANDPALWIKVGDSSSSTPYHYVKFTPATSLVDSVSSEGGQLLEGDVLFASGTTATTSQVTEAVNFKSEGGKMTGNIILDKSLDTGSTHAVVNSAVTTAINEVKDSAHTHTNKTVLDGITSAKVSNWDAGYTYRVTGATGDTYVTASVANNKVTVGATSALTEAVGKAHTHNNQAVLDGITSGKVSNWDSAFTNMLTGVTHGTDGTFVTTTVGDKSNKSQSIGVAVTTAATSAATSSANGLATAYETKQYIDSKTTNIKNVTTIDGQAVGSSADTLNFATGNSLVTKSTAKNGNVITTTIGVTTGATSSSTAGLAVNTDVKDYVDKATITGDGFVIGASGLSVSHKAYSVTNTAKTASPAHGGTFVAISDIKYDGHGHVSAATATTVTLPFETTLSTGTSGSGNVVTGITVDNHKVTKVMGYAVTSASGDDYISANTTNGALTVQLKSVAAASEDIAGASATGSVADAKAVKDYVDSQVTSSVNYKGATSSLPNTASSVGDLFITTGSIAIPSGRSGSGVAVTAETGDYIICRDSGTTASKWDVIEKNLTGAVTSSAALTTNALVVGNANNQTVKKASAVGDASHPIYINASGVPVSGNAIPTVSATDGSNALAWNSAVTLATVTINGTATTIDAKLPANPNTDTATTEDGHYEPSTTAETIGATSGDNYIKGIRVDSKNHVISVVTGTPKNTTYTFASGASGNFTVTPAGGSAQTVSIGKPATAGTADKVGNKLTITYEDGTASKEYDGSSAVTFEIPKVVDEHVTAVGNHYTPTSSTTKSATTNYAIAGLRMDAAGHVTAVVDSAHKVEKDVPSNAVFTDTKVTSAANHYTGGTAASTAGTSTTFIRQIVLDAAKHVVSVTTGSPAAVAVVDCASTITTASTTLGTIDGNAITAKIGVTNSGATIPMSASTATTLATVGGVNITAKTSMNKLTIAGANSKENGETFDGKSDIEILVLDCGEY